MAPLQRHIDSIIANHMQYVWDKARQEGIDLERSMEVEQRIFMYICDCDPTQDGQYLDWLSEWRQRLWVPGSFRTVMKASDLSHTMTGLRAFHAIRPFIPADQADIWRYRDWRRVWFDGMGWELPCPKEAKGS